MSIIGNCGLFGLNDSKKHIALFVDGPHIITRRSNFDLNLVIKEVSKEGKVKIAKVFLDQYASDKLIEAMTNQGYDALISISDIDVALSVAVMEQLFNPAIGQIAIMTTSRELAPLFERVKKHGRKLILVGASDTLDNQLKAIADDLVVVKHRIRR